MHGDLKHWKRPLAVTAVLVALIAAASFFVTNELNRREEADGFTRLEEEAEKLSASIQQAVHNDQEKLTLIAEIMADHENDMESCLRLYQKTGTCFSRLELLLPGDQVVDADGNRADTDGKLSFEEEAARGIHISDRTRSLDDSCWVVRQFVPIQHDGETLAVLCGVVELASWGNTLPYSPYSGQAAVYLIDGATGDFLIDTWHTGEELGNLWALGSRPMAKGYNDLQLRQGMVKGESNFVVFVSNTTKEYLYFYYTPLAINQWRVGLSVPEDLVFSEARNIRRLLDFLLAVESIACLLYIFWMIFYVRRETGEKQRQLDALNYIYDVEKLLFNAHEHQENIPRSLEVIARMLPAQRVSFTMLPSGDQNNGYLWEKGGESPLGAAMLASAPDLAVYFEQGKGEISAHSLAGVRAVLPSSPDQMTDLAAIPVEDGNGTLRGILAASGLPRRSDCAAMLRSVAFSYAKLWSNTRTYQEMRRQGTEDSLTGLYNRNRYEQDLARIAGECKDGMCCVFIDANGLHELNNTRGHEAGDQMLRTIAWEVESRLGFQRAYRIGGDEFVIFTVDEPQGVVTRHSQAIAAALEQKGYHVSIGVAWAPAPVENLDDLVKEAERRMYQVKSDYYQTHRSDRHAR